MSDPKPKKILIITSSGGGGHFQSAKAKEQELSLKNPTVLIIQKDLLIEWGVKWFGKFCVNYWNRAQTKGDMRAQKICLVSQFFVDWIFWPTVLYYTLQTLLREDIDHVIDTQPLGTSAILRAIRIFNKMRDKKVYLEKLPVDLPTKRAQHFFRPIRKLSRKSKQLLRMQTIAPLLEGDETPQSFWHKHCKIPESQVKYEAVCVRQSFRKLQGKKRGKEHLEVPIAFKSAEELAWIKRSYQRGKIRAARQGDQILFSIAPEDKLCTLLLGSYPLNEAVFNYIKQFLKYEKQREPKTLTHLFVFVAEDQAFLKRLVTYIAEEKEYPSHFSIVPFSFQSDEVIAPMFHRSDLTITRSGGQTSMELMCVSSGEAWIHSNAKVGAHGKVTEKQLLQGIPVWEAENAVYLQKTIGAKIVTLELTFSFLQKGAHFVPQALQYGPQLISIPDCESIA